MRNAAEPQPIQGAETLVKTDCDDIGSEHARGNVLPSAFRRCALEIERRNPARTVPQQAARSSDRDFRRTAVERTITPVAARFLTTPCGQSISQ